MDQIFYPAARKWVSRPVKMGRFMSEMKNLVRNQKERLVIIDPTPSVGAYMGKGIDTDDTDAGTSSQYPPDFMKSEAMQFENEELIFEAESEIEKHKRDKWSESDAACEAAVAKLKNKDFFLFKKKKKEKGEKRNRSNAKMSVEEDMDEADEEDDEDDDDVDYEQPGTSTNAKGSQSENLVDSKMYEQYNYDQSAQQNGSGKFENELEKMMAITDASEMSLITPEAFNESDENDDDWLDCDDETDNFAGFAQRLDGLKEMIENGSEDSEEDDEKGNNLFSDEEQESFEQTNKTSPEDGETPCCSKSLVLLPTAPMHSALKQPGKRKEKQGKRVTIGKVEVAGIDSSTSNSQNVSATKESVQQSNKKEPVQDDTTDFKRFTDWVFSQNCKRDKENRKAFRPFLKERANMTEEQVRVIQCLTSANLASVKGEVFQDEQVMQSSSMPLLAPPTNILARTTLQSLAIFLTHGEDPSVFPWKSINVQQQMNDDFINHQFMERMEQQRLDVINPAMKDKLVNKEDDFLVQILIYQATDPEDVLPDEVKLNRNFSSDVDIVAAVGSGKKRGKPAGTEYFHGGDDCSSSSVNGPHRFIEPKLAYEVHMLGSQTVKDLMLMFHCENDYVCLKDTPHPGSYQEDASDYAKAKFPASMIVINDIMYTDPACEVKYTEIINEWASKLPHKSIDQFKKGDWNSKLSDITLRFGFPYVYVHLGGCEHIYVFTKSRLLHREDNHLLSSYPSIVGMTRFKNVYCRVDNEYLARWAVLDFKEFPENPMLLCTECVLMYCYDKNKRKMGDFKLYPFTQMANIL